MFSLSARWFACISSAALAFSTNAPSGTAVQGYRGVVVPRHSADLAASAAATVREVLVHVGDTVRAGQLLARLESPELDRDIAAAGAELTAARADSSRASAELVQASAVFERREKASDVFTKEEMEGFATRKASATAGLEVARAGIAERQAYLEALEERSRSLALRAPFAGQVTARQGGVGEFFAAGRPLIRIATTADLWIRFAVPAAERDGLEVGREITVTVDDAQRSLGGKIEHIAPEVDTATGMIFAEASLAVGKVPPPVAGTTVRVTLRSR